MRKFAEYYTYLLGRPANHIPKRFCPRCNWRMLAFDQLKNCGILRDFSHTSIMNTRTSRKTPFERTISFHARCAHAAALVLDFTLDLHQISFTLDLVERLHILCSRLDFKSQMLAMFLRKNAETYASLSQCFAFCTGMKT